MFSNLRHRANSQEGFTLIELLVVILIIGILAAIAIPNFLGQTAKANDASAKSNVRNAVSQMESCFTDQQTYVGCTLSGAGLPVGTGKGLVSITAQSATGYTITATSQSNNTFTMTNTNGTYTYPCSSASGTNQGGCPSSNSWSS